MTSSIARAHAVEESTEETQARWQDTRARLLRWGILELAVVLVVVLAFGAIAYQQWRTANSLRATIDEITNSGSARFVQPPVESARRRLAPAARATRLEASDREVAADERERLEGRGASLIGSNDFSGALTHYQMLSELFPGEAVFRNVANVLRTKLRCAGPAETASSSCP